jgi:6-phospho-3-hexuloisomerase
MNITDTAFKAAEELAESLKSIKEQDVQKLVEMALNAKRVFFAGSGRSLLALRCVAMRFMHVGFDVYVVGDTTTPAFGPEDLLIAGSGSGETGGIINVVTKAKKIGGKTALFSIRRESSLASLCDLLVQIPAYTDKVETDRGKKTILPGGTLFEEAMLLLGDTMILQLGEVKGVATNKYFDRHANLE